VAIFHLDIHAIGRSTTRTASDVAAYRAGERLTDPRNGAVHDYTQRTDVLHKEIVLPSRFASEEASWARDRQSLWNAAEAAESRRNSRFAREYQVALPSELEPAQRQALTVSFARNIADRYGVAVDVAIHAPTADGDARNYHAHLLSTTREVTSEGLGRKVGLELREASRRELGLASTPDEFRSIRASWAEHTNAALRTAGLEARVDHRSLAAQGIDREPKHQPWHIYKAAQRALAAEVAERARTLHRERGATAESVAPAAAKAGPPVAERTDAAERVESAQRREVAEAGGTSTPARAQENASLEQATPGIAAAERAAPEKAERRSLEDIQREARENWAAYRAASIAAERAGEVKPAREAEAPKEASNESTERTATHKPDDDLGL
jgi:ATP-dependent exoDNAse (exonuclease V) alpha subunit